ncbi:MAG: hypothetical protein EOO10_18425 [Chitinophagaceae bacterium]|nr:MAG: hypothetical protein EOO10_18425 [Chitinophagaceae bacterium]
MSNEAFNPQFVIKKERLFKGTEPSPKALAITYFMMGTGVYRLYTQQDFEEFFKRLVLLYSRQNLADNFFLKDYLFSFYANGEKVVVRTAELPNFIGLSFGQGCPENVPFEKFFENVDKNISNSIFVSIFKGLTLFNEYYEASSEAVVKEDGTITPSVSFNFNKTKAVIDSEAVEKAMELSRIIVREIPDQAFFAWEKSFPDAIKNYDQAVEDARKELEEALKLQFDFDSLPEENKQFIEEHFRCYFPGDEYEENMDTIKALTYLAWLYANYLMIEDEMGCKTPWYPYHFDTSSLGMNGWFSYDMEYEDYSLDNLYDDLNAEYVNKAKK